MRLAVSYKHYFSDTFILTMLESPSQFLCIQTNKKHKDWGKLNLKIDQCFIVTLKHSECNDNDNQDCIMIEQTPDKRSKNNFANYNSEDVLL